MKSADFVALLANGADNAFEAVNGAYPKLKWQASGGTEKTKLEVTFTNAVSANNKWVDSAQVYDGKAHTVAMSSTADVSVIKYRENEEEEWSTTAPSLTNAGSITFQVRAFPATEDYEATYSESDIYTVTFTLGRAAVAADPVKTNNNDFTYDGTEKIGVEAPAADAGYSLSGTTKATAAGRYAVTASVDSNHTWTDTTTADKTINWMIRKAMITAPTAADNLTYNGQPQGLTVPAGCDVSGDPATATNAGNYATVLTPDSNHYWDPNGDTDAKTIEWSIARATATVTANDASKVYGTADPTLTATVTGTFGSDTLSYTLNRQAGEDVNTGGTSYSIVASGEATQGNYTVTYNNGKFTITPAGIDVPTAVTGLVYNGAVQTGVAVPDGCGYTATGNTATNAGSYTATVTPDANHQWKDGTTAAKAINWSIAKAKPTLTVVPASLNLTAIAKSGSLSYAYSGDGTVSAVSSDTDVATVAASDEANKFTVTGVANGTATITVSAAEGTNYLAPDPVTVSITVQLKTYGNAPVPTGKSLVYNGQEQTGVEPDSGSTLSGTVKATNVGSYEATATLDVDNYVWNDGVKETSRTVSWSISAAPMTNFTAVVTNASSLKHTGSAVVPQVEVRNANGAAIPASDYTVKYYSDAACTQEVAAASLIEAGTYYVKAWAYGTNVLSGTSTAAVSFAITDGTTPTPDPGPDPTPTPDPSNPDDPTVVVNPDGSTTTTVTDPTTGTVTKTTVYPDGKTIVETIDGATKATTTKTTQPNGVVTTVEKNAVGQTTSTEVVVPEDAAKAGAVELPIDAQAVGSAAAVNITAPKGAVLVMPASGNVGDGVVPVAVDTTGKLDVIEKSLASNGSVSFVMPAATAQIRIENHASSFADVKGNEWFVRDGIVAWATSHGIITGVQLDNGGLEFQGDVALSRAMFATMLNRLEDSPKVAGNAPFYDVAPTDWCNGTVAWAANKGIIEGYGDGNFGPNDNITREQMAVMLMRYAKMCGLDTSARADLSGYSDARDLTYGEEAMRWAVAEGLISGYEGSNQLGALNGATRAEACTVLQRMIAVML